MKIKFKGLVQIFFLLIVLVSCSDNASNSKKKIFNINLDQGLTSLDPAFARNQNALWMCNQLYNSLVQIDDSLHIKPSLAKRWKISEDGLTYIFYIRNDVFFHDDEAFINGKGRKMTASDIVYSFKRILNPQIASSGSWIFSDKIDTKNGFSAPNDSLFIIKLRKPFPPFLTLLSSQYCSIIPHEVAEKFGKEFRLHPVGTGPFKFKYWKEGEVLALIKNENYFEKDANGKPLPYLDAVKATFIPDKQTAFMEFLKKNLDYFNGIDGSYRDDILTKNGKLSDKYMGKFKMQIGPYLNTEYIGIQMDATLPIMKNSPLVIKKVRQAINYAIDKKKLIKYLRNNIGTPAHSGFIPLGMPGFDSTKVKGYYYDPAKAKKLLLEAGFSDDKKMPTITLSTTTTYKDLIEFVQGELNKIGIKTNIEISQSAALRETIAKRGVRFFRASWIADYADGEIYLSMFSSKNLVPNGPNYTSFNNKKFDQLFESINYTSSNAERYKLYQQLDQIIMNEAPVVVLYYDQFVNLYQNNISGLSKNAQNLLTLKKVFKN